MNNLDLIKDALAICMALKNTLITPELEEPYRHHLAEAQRLLNAAIGEAYLKGFSELPPDDQAPAEPADE